MGNDTRVGLSPLVSGTTTTVAENVGSLSSTESHPTSPVALPEGDDTFVTIGGSGRKADLSPFAPSGMPKGRVHRHGAVYTGADRLPVQGNESWHEALKRHFGRNISPAVGDLIIKLNGSSLDAPPPPIIRLPELSELYVEQYAGRQAPLDLGPKPSFVLAEPGQSWLELAEQQYGSELSGQALAGIAEALAYANGRSLLDPTLGVIGVPDLRQLHELLRQIQSAEKAPKAKADAMRISVTGGSLEAPANTPTAGSAYNPRATDSLRGVVTQAYRNLLDDRSLSAAERERLAEDIMLLLVAVNGLKTDRIGEIEALWLPECRLLTAMLERARSSGELERARREPSLHELVDSIEKAAFGVTHDLEARRPRVSKRLESQNLEPATSAVANLRYERAMSSSTARLPWGGNELALALEFGDQRSTPAPVTAPAPADPIASAVQAAAAMAAEIGGKAVSHAQEVALSALLDQCALAAHDELGEPSSFLAMLGRYAAPLDAYLQNLKTEKQVLALGEAKAKELFAHVRLFAAQVAQIKLEAREFSERVQKEAQRTLRRLLELEVKQGPHRNGEP